MSFFCIDNLTAGYGKHHIIKDISFSAPAGCLVGVIGANGSGKTTLLKALCGILPHQGTCNLDGVTLEKLSPKQLSRLCGYIPQRSGISIDISALDVVLMGFNPYLGILEKPNRSMINTATQVLSMVGLEGKENTNYMHLSEGQKQLCILARTLVTESKLLLLDEPESALDFRFRYRMLSLLRNYVTDSKKAAIVTLHDPVLALNHCDRLILLANGTVLGTINPNSDDLKQMEQMLCMIYGNICLQRCINRSGHSYLVMLKEEEQ
jgi:iron complex transport system ATP-binding protein